MKTAINELLTIHPLFNELEAIGSPILDTLRIRHFSKDAVVYRPGIEASHAYLIIDGAIKFEMSASSGQSVFIGIVDKHFLIGELELLSGLDYQSTAIANVDCTLLLIPKETLLALITQQPNFALKFTRQLATNFYFFQIITAEKESSDLKARLANLLMSHGLRFGRRENEQMFIDISNEQLSEMLNASRQRINMQLNEWQKSALIQCRYGKITINDINEFSTLSGLAKGIISEENIIPYQ